MLSTVLKRVFIEIKIGKRKGLKLWHKELVVESFMWTYKIFPVLKNSDKQK